MSKQARHVREHLARLKAQGIILPEAQDPRQLWILVIMHPRDNSPGEVFVTHGKNFDKFTKRPGFEPIGRSFDRMALTEAARKLTKKLGPNYQPRFSAAAQPEPTPEIQSTEEPSLPEMGSIDSFEGLPTTEEDYNE